MDNRGAISGVETMLSLAGVSKPENQYTKEIRGNVLKGSFTITGI